MTPALLFGLGAAQAAPDDLAIHVAVSPDATLEVLPARNGHLDLVVHGNREPLHDALDAATAPWLVTTRAVSVGSGTWLVDLGLSATSPPLVTELRDGTLIVQPGKPSPAAAPDPAWRHPVAPPDVGLHPLWGKARTLALASTTWPLTPPSDGVHLEGPLARPPSWKALGGYRQVLVEAVDEHERNAARSRLAEAYLALGAPREALFYLDALHDNHPSAALQLRRADALIRLGRIEPAREACTAARELGAGATALSCLARIALREGDPDASPLAAALLLEAEGPVHRLLGAELLASEHRWGDARPVLEALSRSFPVPLVWAELGDARYATGDIAGARSAWQRAGHDERLRPLLTVRQILAELANHGPPTWSRSLPDLLELADRPGSSGAEARYLISQIVETWGDRDVAIRQLSLLWDAEPETALRSDVPERLVAACRQRMAALARSDRPVEELAVFRTCWRDDLDELVADPAPIERASHLLYGLGLPHDAITLLQRALAIRARRNDTQPAPLLALASLYTATGRPEEALRTLQFAARSEGAAALRPWMAVEEGLAHAALGHTQDARARWRGVKDGDAAVVARMHLGLSLAREGACTQATPMLREVLAVDPRPEGPTVVADDDLVLALARCLVDHGDPKGAADVVHELVASHPGAGDEAHTLIGRAALQADDIPPPTEGAWKSIVEADRSGEAWIRDAKARLANH